MSIQKIRLSVPLVALLCPFAVRGQQTTGPVAVPDQQAAPVVAVSQQPAPVAALAQVAGPGNGELLTLDRAINLALGANRLIKNSEIELGKFADREAVVRSGRMPEIKFSMLSAQFLSPLDFTFGRGLFGTYPGVGPIPAQNTVVSMSREPLALSSQINQPLSQLYRIGLNLKQLRIGRDMAEQQVRAQQQSIINQVTRTYYAILQTQSALQTTDETIKLYQELDRVTGEYVVQRVALKTESLEVKTRLARSEYDALTLRDQAASQKEQLNQLLGRDIRTEFEVSPVPEFSRFETDLSSARSYAMEMRPEVQEAQLKIQQAEYDRRIKKSAYIPDVSLNFNYQSAQNIYFMPKHNASIGLAVVWEPFDWGRKRWELSEKDKSLDQARNGLHETQNQVLMEVNGKYRQLQQARSLLTIGQLAQETARENVRILSNRYSMQAALLKDVLQAQTSLTESHHQYRQALLAFWMARADFQKAIGEDK